ILVERAWYGLAFFHTVEPARRPTSLPTPSVTPIALLDKAANLAKKLERPNADLEAAIALARAKDAAHSNTPAAATEAAQLAVEKARSSCGQDQSAFGAALYLSALAHLRAEKLDDAESELLEVLTIFVERIGDESLPYAEAAEQLASLWRRTNRLDESIPLSLAAFKARYRSAATNLPYLADLGLQSLYLENCLPVGLTPSPAELNRLKPNDPQLAAECARWAITLSGVRNDYVGAGRFTPPQTNPSSDATRSTPRVPVSEMPANERKFTDLYYRRLVARLLTRERSGNAEPDAATQIDRLLEKWPQALSRFIDDAHPLHSACSVAALRKAVTPTGVAIFLAHISDPKPPSAPADAIARQRVVAWIIPGEPNRSIEFFDLGDMQELTRNNPAKPIVVPDRRDIVEPDFKTAGHILTWLRTLTAVGETHTLYLSGIGYPWSAFSTEKQRTEYFLNLSVIVNDLPPAPLPELSDAPAGADNPVGRAKNKSAEEPRPADWRRPAAS
ncbi:MAG TPA: hypothetical protein VGE52_14760, partial [Pirellulales bacterium]